MVATAGRTRTRKPAPEAAVPAQRKQPKPPPRRRVDPRTKTMSAEALTCRTLGHAPTQIPVPADERRAHREQGKRLIKTVCLRDCSYWRNVVVDLGTGERTCRSGYTDRDSYCVMAKGTGRLPQSEATLAWDRLNRG